MLGLIVPLTWSNMIFVPLPKTTPGFAAGGLAWGPWARTSAEDMSPGHLDPDVLLAATAHGAHVARVTARLHADPAPLFDHTSSPTPRHAPTPDAAESP